MNFRPIGGSAATRSSSTKVETVAISCFFRVKAAWYRINDASLKWSTLHIMLGIGWARGDFGKAMKIIMRNYENMAIVTEHLQEQQRAVDTVSEAAISAAQKTTAGKAAIDALHQTVMKAASAELKANQAAVHEEHGDGLCWEKGKGAGALIKKYKKANPLWRSCTPKTLRNWTRDHAGQSPPAKSVDRKRIFSDEIESKVAEAAIAASKDNRPQTISRIREQLQTLVTGSSL